jgi:5'-methylthioadenosine phosphorylase
MTKELAFAVIGGSGLYSMPGLEVLEEKILSTPFGETSSPIIIGNLEDQKIAFLARHGLKHQFNPSEVNYRANIYALKSLGLRFVLAISACGSLREDYAPGQLVIPDQLFDFTRNRDRSFFEEGLVAHVDVADPFCRDFNKQVLSASQKTKDAKVHSGGSYITVEGPRFSTRAESDIFRSWGLSLIGMTTSPEAFLAREAEMHYSVLAHITDYDVWHDEPVNAEMVIRTIQKNTTLSQETIRHLAAQFSSQQSCNCEHALANAFLSVVEHAPEETKQRLGILIEKYRST